MLSDIEIIELNNYLVSNMGDQRDLGGSSKLIGNEFEVSIDNNYFIDDIKHKVQNMFHVNLSAHSSWVSVSKWNESVFAHNHINPGSQLIIFTAVYYLEANGNDDFTIENPDTFQKLLNNNTFSFKPRKNDFVVFPGWLKHWVVGNTGKDPRICIVIDFKFSS
jgi:hypothetical protein